jgi:tetratricopeptide (TPR) repeat protein
MGAVDRITPGVSSRGLPLIPSFRRFATALLGGALLIPGPVGRAGDQPPAPDASPASPRADDGREPLARGLSLAREGRYDEAIDQFRAHLTGHPGDAEGHLQLGRALLQRDMKRRRPPLEAVEEMEAALKLDPSRAVIRLQLADIYGKRVPGIFRPDRMVSLFEDLITAFPDRPEVRLAFGRSILTSEVRMKRKEDHPTRTLQDSAWAMDVARFHLDKAIDLAPAGSDTSIDSRSLLGEVLFRSGEWDAAQALFEDLIRSYPDRGLDLAPAWETIGHCHWRRGEFEKAAAAFRTAFDINPSLPRQYGMLLAYEARGGYPPDLPERYRLPRRPEAVDPAHPPDLRFSHIDKPTGAGPAGWADYNGDGRYDLVVCGCDNFCSLYRATPDGFVDATLEAKLGRLEPGFGAAWADYDNDGDPDLYIARNGWNGPAVNSLLRNNGDGTFTDVAEAAGVTEPGSSFHCAWLDYDRDGWLDLIVSNGVYIDGSTNQLYRNLGNGRFENVTRKAGLAMEPLYGCIGVAIGDYDGDGWVDLFFHGRMEPNRLFHNNGDGTFTDRAAEAGVQGPGSENAYVAFFSDMDSDGDLDIFTTALEQWEGVIAGYRADFKDGSLDNIPRLYRNEGNGRFTDISIEAGFRYPLGIMAGNIADLDNDGYRDIYLGTGNPEVRRLEPNIFYHNVEGRRFEDLTRFTGTGAFAKGHGVIFHDWDDDGDLDMFAHLGGFFHGDWARASFFLNEAGNRNGWLRIKLSQPRLNRDAIGAHVTVTAGTWRQVQVMTAGVGFGSTDPPILHYGLGSRRKVDKVEIVWPDGSRQVLTDVAGNRTLRIARADGAGPAGGKRPAGR